MSKIILENSKEFLASGQDNLTKARYNAATDSFFKAFVTLCDYMLQKKVGYLPKNHTERFSMLELQFKEVYLISVDLFKIYRRTYNLKATKNDAENTKNEVEKIIEYFNLKEEM